MTATNTNMDSDSICPRVLILTSIEERKVVYSVPNEGFIGNIESHILGKATLGEIIKAEESVEPIKDEYYDLTENSCIHYAFHISRALKMEETPEVADFLIRNLLKDDGLIKVAKEKLNSGGLRILNYAAGIGADGMIEKFVKDTVFSQLDIKGDTTTGKTSLLQAVQYSIVFGMISI